MQLVNPIARLSVCLVLLASLGSAADPDERTLGELREERMQALEELVELSTRRFELGHGTWDSVVLAQRNLLDAKLEMSATAEERVAVREAHLKLMQEYERVIATRVENGDASRALLIQARADRLRAHIELLKEKRAE